MHICSLLLLKHSKAYKLVLLTTSLPPSLYRMAERQIVVQKVKALMAEE
jgi:hypothetical protein